jgi:hypothetical protein
MGTPLTGKRTNYAWRISEYIKGRGKYPHASFLAMFSDGMKSDTPAQACFQKT